MFIIYICFVIHGLLRTVYTEREILELTRRIANRVIILVGKKSSSCFMRSSLARLKIEDWRLFSRNKSNF